MPDIHDFRFVTNQINKNDKSEEQSWKKENTHFTTDAYSARTAHPFQRNGALFRFKLSKAQQVY